MREMLSFASYFVEPFISSSIHCFIFMVPNTPVLVSFSHFPFLFWGIHLKIFEAPTFGNIPLPL